MSIRISKKSPKANPLLRQATMHSRTSGGQTTCMCDFNVVVPILDLISGILSKFCFCTLGQCSLLFLCSPHSPHKHFCFFSVCLCAFLALFGAGGFGFQSLLICLWGIFFGLTLILLALCMPPCIAIWFPFLRVFWGKGLFVILGGCLVGAWSTLRFITFLYCMILGFVYIILHFLNCCSAGPRPLMRGGGGGGTRTTTTTTTVRNPGSRGPGRGANLPRGWTSHLDAASGQTFYSHTNGTVQWTRP